MAGFPSGVPRTMSQVTSGSLQFAIQRPATAMAPSIRRPATSMVPDMQRQVTAGTPPNRKAYKFTLPGQNARGSVLSGSVTTNIPGTGGFAPVSAFPGVTTSQESPSTSPLAAVAMDTSSPPVTENATTTVASCVTATPPSTSAAVPPSTTAPIPTNTTPIPSNTVPIPNTTAPIPSTTSVAPSTTTAAPITTTTTVPSTTAMPANTTATPQSTTAVDSAVPTTSTSHITTTSTGGAASTTTTNSTTTAPSVLPPPQPSLQGNTVTIEVHNDRFGSSGIRFIQMEQVLAHWSTDLQIEERTFIRQATHINAMNFLLMENVKKLTELNNQLLCLKFQQQRIEYDLDFLLCMIHELDNFSLPLELRSQTLIPEITSDLTRRHLYGLVEGTNVSKNEIKENLMDMINLLNEQSGMLQPAPPPALQLTRILNAHYTSLIWIDRTLKEMEKSIDENAHLLQLYEKVQKETYARAFQNYLQN